MGGYGSGGYRWGRQRVTAESCYRFDAKMITGLFKAQPGATARTGWTWSTTSGMTRRDTAAALVEYRAGASVIALTLVREGERETQQIRVSTTPCRFGGVRYWLHCPLCGRRAFRLYLYPRYYAAGRLLNLFWCRACMGNGLSYSARNTKDLLSIGQDRARRIARKLKGDPERLWNALPDKPKWMRWKTYARLAEQHQNAVQLADAGFVAGALRRFPHLFADVRGER